MIKKKKKNIVDLAFKSLTFVIMLQTGGDDNVFYYLTSESD